MNAILDTQDTIAPDDCPECGGWLHREQRGGYLGDHLRFCSVECLDEYVERSATP